MGRFFSYLMIVFVSDVPMKSQTLSVKTGYAYRAAYYHYSCDGTYFIRRRS